MGFSGFFRLHTCRMATGKSAISRALQSKKPKKHPPPQQIHGTHDGYTQTGCDTNWRPLFVYMDEGKGAY